MIFSEQLKNISTVLNSTGNITNLLTSFNTLDAAQQKVLLSSSLLSEKQKEQCITMTALSAANTRYTAEQLTKATGISAETLANWGLLESTDALTISEIAEKAASDAQAKAVLDKIIAQNAEAIVNGNITASNTALTASEGGATLATGAFTTAIKANIKALWTWMTTTPIGWLTLLVSGVFATVKAYDTLTISISEQKEKMEESLSAYQNAKSELSNITTELEEQEQAMDDLLAKDKLTYTEQGQLEKLKEITQELRIQKDLNEKEEEKTQKEAAEAASDLFRKQFGKNEISEDAIENYYTKATIHNEGRLIETPDDISQLIAGYNYLNDKLEQAYDSGNQKTINHFKTLIKNTKDDLFSTANELQEQQNNISDYYNKIKDTPYEDLTEKQQEIVDSYNDISTAIALIYKYLDPTSWNTMQIDNLFATDGIEKTKEELIEMAKEGTLDENTIQSYSKLNSILEDSSIILAEGQSPASALCDEIYALADAEKEIQDSTSHLETNIPTEFNSAWNSLGTTGTEEENKALLEEKDRILELAEAGKLTEKILSKSSLADIFNQAGVSIEEATEKINEMESSASQLASMKTGISSISSILSEKKENLSSKETRTVGIGADTLNAMPEDVKAQTKEYEHLIKVLGNGNSKMKDCQDAANKLATAYVTSNNFLAKLTDGNKKYYIFVLQQMGVENADAIVTDTLNKQKINAKIASFDLTHAKEEENKALVNYISKLDESGNSLAYYMIQQQIANNNALDSSVSIIKYNKFLNNGNKKNGSQYLSAKKNKTLDKLKKNSTLIRAKIDNANSLPHFIQTRMHR